MGNATRQLAAGFVMWVPGCLCLARDLEPSFLSSPQGGVRYFASGFSGQQVETECFSVTCGILSISRSTQQVHRLPMTCG